MSEEFGFPIAKNTQLAQVPAFSILLPENLAHSKKFLQRQEERFQHLLEAYDSRCGGFGDLIIAFDYDVIDDYMFPFTKLEMEIDCSRQNKSEHVANWRNRAERHARAKVLFDIFPGKRFLPLGTVLDIERALAIGSMKKGMWDLLDSPAGALDEAAVTQIIENARDMLDRLKIYNPTSISESESHYHPIDRDKRWNEAIRRLYQLLLGAGTEASSRWMSREWNKSSHLIHRPVFQAVFTYLHSHRGSQKPNMARWIIADIADALSIAQIVQLILLDRKNDLLIPSSRTSIEYLYITNTSLLLENEFYKIVENVLRKELMTDRPIFLDPFTISPKDILATRFANDRPGTAATRVEIRNALNAVNGLQDALVAAAESPLWEDFAQGMHGCIDIAGLLLYIATMSSALPGAIKQYVHLVESPLFQADMDLELAPACAQAQLLEESAEQDLKSQWPEIERYLDCLEKTRQLHHFLNGQFSHALRSRLGLEMEHFGLSEEIHSAPERNYKEHRIVKKMGEGTGKTIPHTSIWLIISRWTNEPPIVRWRALLGPLDALVIAKQMEALAPRCPLFKPDNGAGIIFRGKDTEVELPAESFSNSQEIYTRAVAELKNPIALTSVECRFSSQGPVVAVGLDIENNKTAWMASLSEVEWESGTPQENADWVMKALHGSHLSTIHIPGVRSWIEKTLIAFREGKE